MSDLCQSDRHSWLLVTQHARSVTVSIIKIRVNKQHLCFWGRGSEVKILSPRPFKTRGYGLGRSHYLFGVHLGWQREGKLYHSTNMKNSLARKQKVLKKQFNFKIFYQSLLIEFFSYFFLFSIKLVLAFVRAILGMLMSRMKHHFAYNTLLIMKPHFRPSYYFGIFHCSDI